MKNFTITLIVAIFLFGFIVRLYKITEPIADWHSFRQSDTAAVSKIYAQEGYDILHPKYFDISNVQSGLDNPNGYRFVEFPIINVLHGLLYNTGTLSLEIWGRLISITASLFTGLAIYFLVKKYANFLAAIFSLLGFLFLPFSIFYSRTILPDVTMTASIMLGIYFFDKYLEKSKSLNRKILFYVTSLFFVSLSFLLKPFALFFVLPIIFLAFKKYGFKTFLQWPLYLFAFIAVTPLALWRYWISQFPEGIPVSAWLFNGNNIRFRPAFFRWIFFERITKLILGFAGSLFILASIFQYKNKNFIFFLSFAVSSLFYLFTIATGNVQHDYYQILIIPTVCIFFGLGASSLYSFIKEKFNKHLAIGFVSFIFISSFYFSWMQVKDYFNINDRIMVAAGKRADEILPQDAKVIAPHDGSTTFLNIISRRGWPVFQADIDTLIKKGATHLVISNPTASDFSGFGKTYKVVDSSKEYLILELR